MRHRLFLLGLLILTVVGVGAAAPANWSPDPAVAYVRVAVRIVLAGVLVLLWAYWLRADRRSA